MNTQDLSQQELARLGFLSRRSQGNFIDGAFREAHASRRIEVVDPASEMVVAETPDSDDTMSMRLSQPRAAHWRIPPGRACGRLTESASSIACRS
jgi:hypothetical protein